jgi:hypothetical protein
MSNIVLLTFLIEKTNEDDPMVIITPYYTLSSYTNIVGGHLSLYNHVNKMVLL